MLGAVISAVLMGVVLSMLLVAPALHQYDLKPWQKLVFSVGASLAIAVALCLAALFLAFLIAFNPFSWVE